MSTTRHHVGPTMDGVLTHFSWNRDCPEFHHGCVEFDENLPKNDLPYFPREEEWTMISHPSKLPKPEKFPAKFAMSQPPQPDQAPCTSLNPQGRQCKQETAPVPANQLTMDQFVANGNPKRTGNDGEGDAHTADLASFIPSDFDCTNYRVSPRDQCGWRRSGYQTEPCKFMDMVWIWLIPMDEMVTGCTHSYTSYFSPLLLPPSWNRFHLHFLISWLA